MRGLVAIIGGGLLLTGCATLEPASCPAGLKSVVETELTFGRNIGGVPGVSDADWGRFVDEEISPRFPEGFTVTDGQGQWRGPDGVIVREAAKILTVVFSGDDGSAAKLEAVRTAYKTRYRQDGVLLVRKQACAGV